MYLVDEGEEGAMVVAEDMKTEMEGVQDVEGEGGRVGGGGGEVVRTSF